MLILIALVGITTVQIRWIDQALSVREQRFDQNVQDALQAVAWKIELFDAINVIAPKVHKVDKNNVTIVMNDSSLITKKIQSKTQFEWISSSDFKITEKTDSSIEVEMINPGKGDKNMKYLKRNVWSGDSSGHKIEREVVVKFDSSGKYELLNIDRGNDVAVQINRYSSLFNRMALQLAFIDKSLEERIDPATVEQIIEDELSNHAINTGWRYAVFPAEKDTFLFASAGASAKNLVNSKYRIGLFSSDLFANRGELVLEFPERNTYILGSMWWMLGSSLLFILIIVAGFSLTVFIIVRQKKLSDMKTDFINNMTHELKTPISTISLASEMLKNPVTSNNEELKKRYANIIYDENKRLSHQVERVLQLAQLETGELQLNMTKVNLHDLVKEAINKTKLTIENRQGTLNEQLRLDNPIIDADEVHLTNVVFNLLDNANKYSPDQPEITISTEGSENRVSITIEDKGIGMTPETQKRIFDKFYREGNGTIQNVQGFGLGLSYVKLIVDEHGGSIKVVSEPNKGSRLQIDIPRKQAQLV